MRRWDIFESEVTYRDSVVVKGGKKLLRPLCPVSNRVRLRWLSEPLSSGTPSGRMSDPKKLGDGRSVDVVTTLGLYKMVIVLRDPKLRKEWYRSRVIPSILYIFDWCRTVEVTFVGSVVPRRKDIRYYLICWSISRIK